MRTFSFEILSNSIDEAREGYGKKIEITVGKDNDITVCDHGRGIPVDFNNNEGKYNWELYFVNCTLVVNMITIVAIIMNIA